jgi:carbohydrate kinase (thermoresistant glucokinase family)
MTRPPSPDIPPQVLVVMGVSGSGKTTVAAMLAGRLHWTFEEGDNLHPASNVEKMHNGIPLTDEDRKPWLEAIAEWIDHWRERHEHGVITCSALKRDYRRVIIGDRSDVRLVYLKGDKAVIAKRLAARQGHFMPSSLLQSQFDTLEEPEPEERAIEVAIGASPRELVDQIQSILVAEASARSGTP